MSSIDSISRVLLILIRGGVVMRVAYILFQGITNPDDVEACKKRVIYTLKFYVAAELVFVMKTLIMSYF